MRIKIKQTLEDDKRLVNTVLDKEMTDHFSDADFKSVATAIKFNKQWCRTEDGYIYSDVSYHFI